mmetsp:Transcript_17459/g.33378  ORF Transcript_17459/g.33378 Transcript_17459/m.33378 type:complete len:326 (-) Transcript_17459:811-1788(-)
MQKGLGPLAAGADGGIQALNAVELVLGPLHPEKLVVRLGIHVVALEVDTRAPVEEALEHLRAQDGKDEVEEQQHHHDVHHGHHGQRQRLHHQLDVLAAADDAQRPHRAQHAHGVQDARLAARCHRLQPKRHEGGDDDEEVELVPHAAQVRRLAHDKPQLHGLERALEREDGGGDDIREAQHHPEVGLLADVLHLYGHLDARHQDAHQHQRLELAGGHHAVCRLAELVLHGEQPQRLALQLHMLRRQVISARRVRLELLGSGLNRLHPELLCFVQHLHDGRTPGTSRSFGRRRFHADGTLGWGVRLGGQDLYARQSLLVDGSHIGV